MYGLSVLLKETTSDPGKDQTREFKEQSQGLSKFQSIPCTSIFQNHE